MATLNNDIFLTIPYIQNTLEYNIPLTTYTLQQIENLINVEDIKIQPFKENKLGLPVNIGNELTRNIDFVANINNTSDGIIITLNQNILDATYLKIRRQSKRIVTTNYEVLQQQGSLKQQLENDTKNIMNSLQDDEKRINDLAVSVNKYSISITENYDNIVQLQEDLITHKHRASQVIFDPIPTNEATNVQEAIENNELKILQIQSGLIPKENVKVASNVNVDILSVSIIDNINLSINDRVLLMDQTNLAQNGIYFFNGTGLERTLDANSLLKIQAAKVQVQEGTFEKRAFYLVVSDFQGIIENEPIKAVEIFSPLTENQVLLSNLNKLPTNTIIGNKENIIETPTALTVLEVREMLGIENVDNTSDLNKPISTATQVALDLKTNQTDFEDLNTYVATETQNLLTAIETKQNNLPIGGERDYLGYSGNELVVKTFSQGTVGLENVDNTSDLNKPISIAQQEEFDKYPKPRGLLLVNDLNLTFDFLDGTYIVNNSTSTINLPTEVEATSSIVLFLQKNFLSNQYNSLNQTLFEKTTTGKNYLYTRNGNVANATFSNWVRLATKEEIDNVNTRVDNILNLTFAGEVYLIPEVDALLAEKESAILPGTSNQYYRGDKVFASLQTDAVIEGQNNFYFSEPRVRASKLTGYQENSATKTLATDNILQAFGKKADLNSPNFTGTATAPTVATNDNSNKLATSTLINLKLNEMLTGEVKAIARQNFNDFTTDGGTGIWLYCNGRAFSVTTYPKLFAVCGYTYGGSGTSFNIPDLRNLVIACASTTEPINKKEGEKKHLITENEMPEHRHSKPDNLTNYIGSGSYGGSAGNSVSGGFASSQFTGKAGGNQPHNNMQPTIYLPYFIYAV